MQDYAPLTIPGEDEIWQAARQSVATCSDMGEAFIRLLDRKDKAARDHLLDGMLPALNAARVAIKADPGRSIPPPAA